MLPKALGTAPIHDARAEISYKNQGIKWCPETELNRRHADFQSGAYSDKSAACAAKSRQTGDEKTTGYAPIVKPEMADAAPEMKNPGALAGATGADHPKYFYQTDEYMLRAKRATELAHAIGQCHPEEARVLMTAALYDLTPDGAPSTYFLSVEDDARWWSRLATPLKLMAMLTATLEFLGDQPMHRNMRKGDQPMHRNMRKRLIVRLFESLPEDDRQAFVRRIDSKGQFVRRVVQ